MGMMLVVVYVTVHEEDNGCIGSSKDDSFVKGVTVSEIVCSIDKEQW